jgi:hypothetical protein
MWCLLGNLQRLKDITQVIVRWHNANNEPWKQVWRLECGPNRETWGILPDEAPVPDPR